MYQQECVAPGRNWNLTLITDLTTMLSLAGPGLFHQTCGQFSNPVEGWGYIDMKNTALGIDCSAGAPAHRLYFFGNTSSANVTTITRDKIIPWIEQHVRQRAIRPVRLVSGGNYVTSAPIDVNVLCDGINFLVSVANASDDPQSASLRVELTWNPDKYAPGQGGFVATDGYTVTPVTQLGVALGSDLLYLPRAIPEHQISDFLTVLDAHVDQVKNTVRQMSNDGYDMRAAKNLNVQLKDLAEPPAAHPEKVLAGLLRLERMGFIKFNANTGSVTVKTLHDGLLSEALVQLEFPLQRHFRRDGSPQYKTLSNGYVHVDASQPMDQAAKIWDFAGSPPQYMIPDVNIVEVHALHPEYDTQCMTWKLGPVSIPNP
jgi:hypothetical protein